MNGFRLGKVFWKRSPETRHHTPVREIMTPSKKLESVAAEVNVSEILDRLQIALTGVAYWLKMSMNF